MQEYSETSPQPNSETRNQKPYVLWDANIIQYLGEDGLGKELTTHFNTLLGEQYRIAVSQFTLLESLDNASVDVEDKRTKVFKSATQFVVDSDVINIAMQLGNLYRDDDQNRKISHGDRIIAATSAILECYICTSNAKDFPYPYFKYVHVEQVGDKIRGKDYCMVVYYILPQVDLISDKIQKRNEKRNRQRQKH